MAVITMSRQEGSLAHEAIIVLGERLGFRVLEKDSLEAALVTMGIPKMRVEQYDERKPGFWQMFSAEKDRYLHFMKTAMYRFAREQDCVIIGRGSQVVFQGLPGVLKVSMIASPAVRAQRIMKRFSVTEERARQIMHQSDTDRSGYHRFFFNAAWDSAQLYDLVVNTTQLALPEAVGVVENAVQWSSFREGSRELASRLEDLCVVQDVTTAILYEQGIPVLFLNVTAHAGVVTLNGATHAASSAEQCGAIAAAIPGVRSVENHVEVVTYHPGM